MLPFISIGSSITLPSYYLAISLTLVLSLFWLVRRAHVLRLSQRAALDLSLVVMITGFIGGRLFHVFYESFSYYQEDYLRILYFWDGGFVFYGGALLSGLAAIIFLSIQAPTEKFKYLDLFAPVLALSYGLGRVGCFMAGCCYGRYCDAPWAVAGRHPTQLYATFWELGAICILLGIEKIPLLKRRPKFLQQDGAIFFLWMILHGTGRLIMESYRDDFRGPTAGLSVSSWISLAIILLGLILLSRRPQPVRKR